ncbi:ABC transporter permease [Pseudonocardiaceae bacterium YIM PH 21723]|nr:ABC transporter permease [Pseudonocardiaceae bacterium YIM PH 21723]
MRASFVFSEVITGLRRNVTMTIAMIITTMISLMLLGSGLLVVRMIDNMQTRFSDKTEVVIYLTNDVSAGDPKCQKDPCSGLRKALETLPAVRDNYFQSRAEAFQAFKELFKDQKELVQLTREEALPANFRVKLKEPSQFPLVVQSFEGKAGVARVVDQAQYIARLFDVMKGVRNGVFAIALLQALAALLLISNTIQVSAFTRRTEVGIMRLVGATRWYTQLPFLLEAVVAGLLGAFLAIGGLVIGKYAIIDDVLQAPIDANILPRIYLGSDILLGVAPTLVGVSLLVSIFTGYVTLRLYVRT